MKLRRVIKWVLAIVLYYTGLVWLFKQWAQKGVLILVFHRITPERVDDGLTVSEAVFTAQLQYIRRKYRVISLNTVSDILKGISAVHGSPIVISFDDGYRDNYTRAWPLLAQHNMPATIFVAVGSIEGDGCLWTEEIRERIWASSYRFLDLRSIGWGSWTLRTDAEKLACLRTLKQWLKALPDLERQEKLHQILQRLGSFNKPGVQEQMLTWEMLREMSKGGFSIGAHTVSHRILTQIEPSEAAWEIRESGNRIERRLGEPVRHFAYPNGTHSDWNAEIQELVKAAGYETACTTLRGINPVGQDMYALRRVEITDAGCTDPRGRFSPALFAMQLAGLFGRWKQ